MPDQNSTTRPELTRTPVVVDQPELAFPPLRGRPVVVPVPDRSRVTAGAALTPQERFLAACGLPSVRARGTPPSDGAVTSMCPIVLDGQLCGVPITQRHWACREHWLLFPAPFRCNANRYRRGTPEFAAMIKRANKLLANDYSEIEPPWSR